jgi:hypothetical protein
MDAFGLGLAVLAALALLLEPSEWLAMLGIIGVALIGLAPAEQSGERVSAAVV